MEYLPDPQVTLTTYQVSPDHPGWGSREKTVLALQRLLECDGIVSELKIGAWKTLASAHQSLKRASFNTQVHEQLLSMLAWAREPLRLAKNNLVELAAARELWRWHSHDQADLRRAANHLESIYREHEAVAKFAPLFEKELDYQEWTLRISAFVNGLVAHGRASVEETLSQFHDYLQAHGMESHPRSDQLIVELGRKGATHPGVADFIRDALSGATSVSPNVPITLARGWIQEVRRVDSGDSHHRIESLLQCCADDRLRALFLTQLFDYGLASVEELRVLAGAFDLFHEQKQLPSYLGLLGRAFSIDFEYVLERASAALDVLENDARTQGFTAFLEASCNTTYGEQNKPLPLEFKNWILQELEKVDSLDEVFDKAGYEVGRLLSLCGGLSTDEFYDRVLEQFILEGSSIEYRHHLIDLIPPETPSEEIQNRLLALVQRKLSSYIGPELLRSLDRDGNWVPTLILRHMACADVKQRLALGRLATAYEFGSDHWRTIARPLLQYAEALEDDDRIGYYLDICPNSWSISGTPGEVPHHYRVQCELAEQQLEFETESCFVGFWRWRLQKAARVLEDEVEEAKEERGE